MQLGYSRRAFEEQFGISAATLQAWEDSKYNISTKGLLKYINALHRAGLITSKEWFLSGVGLPPRPLCNNLQPIASSKFIDMKLSEDEIILREVTFFESINQNPIIIVVSDDSMHPFFDVGDYVGGSMVQGNYASNYEGTPCIVSLNSGEIFLRKIKYGSQKGLFNLISINTDSNHENLFLLDCKINELAQVVWHRKSERIVSL